MDRAGEVNSLENLMLDSAAAERRANSCQIDRSKRACQSHLPATAGT